ncbi:TIGR03083 family protein [Reichenbachiella faecimaris]|uniref:TIGR03083 family protein n=1 Tax=Reichenbachiella faecimaris TaxID=692418 RepID=A0A1W2GD46_REIFA|nr:maleylpyruvate isomerase N-terminal domain-containing protein [Reichenbachiella faecimaris]SMD34590.1 TIGR03083 family protein [Reichenbachiella faecimaris]
MDDGAQGLKKIMIDIRTLFRPLDSRLTELLESLTSDDWHAQTVAKQWKVKDVVSHLLDGNLRVLSMQRDKYFGEQPPKIDSYVGLVKWLNQLNADWVQASKRLSPVVLKLLHQTTGPLVTDYYESLDLSDEAIFAVNWAGESKSLNWMHLAREYTEKWHHQQQIREAVGVDGILTREFFYPCMDIFFLALPYTFKSVKADEGIVIQTTISSDAGGSWFLKKGTEGWQLIDQPHDASDVLVEIPIEISWKLFTKSLRPHDIRHEVKISGDINLGQKVLEMVSVMA